MSGLVVQVNISPGGVPKHPIDVAEVGRLGIAGDKHRYRLHGGPAKALLLMASEVVDALAAENYAVYYGALGENLTTRGLAHRDWRAGQRYRAGSVLLELTDPRQPCAQLEPYGRGIQRRLFDAQVKAGDPASPRWGMSGFYAAVLEPGSIHPGDIIQTEGPPR